MAKHETMAIQFQNATLDNGMQIVAETHGAAHTAAVGFFVKTGSRDEGDEVMGVSHFLEHMMFKGTARRSAADVNREFDEIGANYNASTSQETTAYWAHVLPEYMPRAIDLLSDMLRPALRDDDFDMEKQVILEEIGMYADRPFWVVYEQAMERYYGAHPLSHRVLGTNETITGLRRDQMHAYFERRYSPDNIVVSLSGQLDFDRCVEQIAAACGGWSPSGAERAYVDAAARADEHTVRRPNVKMHYMVGLSAGPSAQDDRRYAASVLAHILGDLDGSRLYWKLIDPGLADEAEVSHYALDRTGLFLHYVSCPPEAAEQVEGIVAEVLDGVAGEIDAEEVRRARHKIALDLTLQNERPAGRMMSLGAKWLYLGEHLPLEEELRRLEAVDVEAVRGVAEAFAFTPRTVVRMTPQNGKADGVGG